MVKYQTIVLPITPATESEAAVWKDGNQRAVGLYCPATLTATSITFLVTYDGSNYVPLYNVGGSSLYSVTVGTNRYVGLDATVFRGVMGLKLKVSAAEAAARTFTLVRSSII